MDEEIKELNNERKVEKNEIKQNNTKKKGLVAGVVAGGGILSGGLLFPFLLLPLASGHRSRAAEAGWYVFPPDGADTAHLEVPALRRSWQWHLRSFPAREAL